MLKINRDNSIELTRGDTARISLTITTASGTAYDYSADTAVFTVKASTFTSESLIQKTVSDGVIYIAPADTSALKYGDYVYDVQLTSQSGDVCTVIPPAKFTVAQEVTWSASQES